MMERKKRGLYILAVFGFILFVAGIILIILFSESEGIMKTLPFICLGLGAGLCGGGVSAIIRRRLILKDPQLAKKLDIDAKDERNIAIANKAKATAYNFTLLIFSALIMFLALVQAEMYVILVFVGAYLAIISVYVYLMIKYNKEM